MEWFAGDIAQCIKKVKTDEKLFLVFSSGEEDESKQISEALNSDEVANQCSDMICLRLESGSTPFTQFCAVYSVPSIPCIHLISPFGKVLSVKSANFTQDQILHWLQETITNFSIVKDREGKHDGSKSQSEQVPDEKKGDEKGQELQSVKIENANANDGTTLKQSDSIELSLSSTCNEPISLNQDDSSTQGNDGGEASQPGLSLEHKIEHAKRLLEEKKKEKAVEEFQKVHEAEIKRREQGRNLTEFKRMQREREIRERLEEQKRERAEKEAVRRQVLAQIEADRRERMAAVAPKPSVAEISSLERKSLAFDPDEVRLQIRLPDGAHMIGVFSAEAYLGTDVREYISARVQGNEISTYNGVTVPPLSEAMRLSFAPVVSRGYIFRQTQLPPPRNFSAEDESTKTLRDLGLWPSSVLTLHSTQTSHSLSKGSVTEYSQNIMSYMFGLVWNGIRDVGGAVYYLGAGLINFGQNTWQTLWNSGGVGGRDGQTLGRASSGNPESRPKSSGVDSDEGRAYRRQGNVSRLSHMPDDTDEQARWNGNSTTQL
nr:UBX domain containing protein 2 [Hymenolepis microstoma]